MRGWLEKARTEKGMTQAEIAKKLDLTENYYFRIEKGERQKKMDITLAAKLSIVLGIPLEDIVELEAKEEEDAEAG